MVAGLRRWGRRRLTFGWAGGWNCVCALVLEVPGDGVGLPCCMQKGNVERWRGVCRRSMCAGGRAARSKMRIQAAPQVQRGCTLLDMAALVACNEC